LPLFIAFFLAGKGKIHRGTNIVLSLAISQIIQPGSCHRAGFITKICKFSNLPLILYWKNR